MPQTTMRPDRGRMAKETAPHRTRSRGNPVVAAIVPLLPHRRVALCAGLVALVMLLAGIVLTAVGVAALSLSGGAAADTSLVVMVAAFGVTDFWGAGLVYALTRREPREIVAAWGLARLALLTMFALLSARMLVVAPVQLLVALPAAWLGVVVAAKQAQLRRAAQRERVEQEGRSGAAARAGAAARPGSASLAASRVAKGGARGDVGKAG